MTGKNTPESPERLRECLEALAKAGGVDAFRCELNYRDPRATVIITCSSEWKEEEVGAFIVGQLRPFCEAAWPPSEQLAALRAEIRALRHVGQQLSHVAFNWSQEAHTIGVRLGDQDRAMLKGLQQEWDAIPRAEVPK